MVSGGLYYLVGMIRWCAEGHQSPFFLTKMEVILTNLSEKKKKTNLKTFSETFLLSLKAKHPSFFTQITSSQDVCMTHLPNFTFKNQNHLVLSSKTVKNKHISYRFKIELTNLRNFREEKCLFLRSSCCLKQIPVSTLTEKRRQILKQQS